MRGGSGDSREDAIVIKNAANHLAGVDAEYLYLQKRFGDRDYQWRLVFQMLLKGEKPIDRLTIELTDGTTKTFILTFPNFLEKVRNGQNRH